MPVHTGTHGAVDGLIGPGGHVGVEVGVPAPFEPARLLEAAPIRTSGTWMKGLLRAVLAWATNAKDGWSRCHRSKMLSTTNDEAPNRGRFSTCWAAPVSSTVAPVSSSMSMSSPSIRTVTRGNGALELPVRSAQETERCAVGRRVDVDLEAPTPVTGGGHRWIQWLPDADRALCPVEPVPAATTRPAPGRRGIRRPCRRAAARASGRAARPDQEAIPDQVAVNHPAGHTGDYRIRCPPRPVTGRREADGITSRRERVSRFSIPEWGQA